MARATLASDRTRIDDSSQPSIVAMFSHQSMNSPSRACGSGYQVERWSSEISGTTVSTAYSTGLKHRTWPSPQLSVASGAPGLAPAGETRPPVEYTWPLPLEARSDA